MARVKHTRKKSTAPGPPKLKSRSRSRSKSRSKSRSRSRSRSSSRWSTFVATRHAGKKKTLPTYGSTSYYKAIGRMAKGVPRKNTFAYPDVPKTHRGKRKNCILRRYSNRRHQYYVPKNMYYRSCGYDKDGKHYDPKFRSNLKAELIDKYKIKPPHNYKTLARAFRRSAVRYRNLK